MSAYTVHIAYLSFECFIGHSQSLKDKRRVTKSLKDRLRNRFNVSVAEIAYMEEWQRSGIGVTMVGNDRRYLESQMGAIRQLLEEQTGFELLNVQVEWV